MLGSTNKESKGTERLISNSKKNHASVISMWVLQDNGRAYAKDFWSAMCDIPDDKPVIALLIPSAIQDMWGRISFTLFNNTATATAKQQAVLFADDIINLQSQLSALNGIPADTQYELHIFPKNSCRVLTEELKTSDIESFYATLKQNTESGSYTQYAALAVPVITPAFSPCCVIL